MNTAKFIAAIAFLSYNFALLPFVHADALDQNLIAKWTFKNGSVASDAGDHVFTEGGNGEIDARDGLVTLRGSKYLLTRQISSSQFPRLASGVTMWARMRFDELPTEGVVNVMSLQNVPQAGSWPSLTFALLYLAPNGAGGLVFLARSQDETELGVGPSRLIPVTVGEMMNVALVFNGGEHVAHVWVNGKLVSTKRATANSLKDFVAFGIGQLQAPGTKCAVTFEEVRIYSTALDAQWLDEITPSKK